MGTGQPYNFCCAKCRGVKGVHGTLVSHWKVTGRRRKLSRSRGFGNGGPSVVNRLIEYRCLDCRHVGWSRHRRVDDALRALDDCLREYDPEEDYDP